MKIVVASDNHGDLEVLKRIVLANQDASLFLHLGDSQMFDYEISPFIGVKGNCDYGKDYPMELYFDMIVCSVSFRSDFKDASLQVTARSS